MDPAVIFKIANLLALIAWIFLVFGAPLLPKVFSVVRYAVPVVLSLFYILALVVADPVEGGGFGSLAAVSALFTSDWVILGGWIHYLAFDFFVGCWIVERSKQEGIPHWWIFMPLFFTFMFGPIGLLLFLMLLGFRKWRAQSS